MHLTVRTDHALRVLMYLAVHDDRLATIREIAERYMISRSHLMTVAYELGRAHAVDDVAHEGQQHRVVEIVIAAFRRNGELLSPLTKGPISFPGSGITESMVDRSRGLCVAVFSVAVAA